MSLTSLVEGFFDLLLFRPKRADYTNAFESCLTALEALDLEGDVRIVKHSYDSEYGWRGLSVLSYGIVVAECYAHKGPSWARGFAHLEGVVYASLGAKEDLKQIREIVDRSYA